MPIREGRCGGGTPRSSATIGGVDAFNLIVGGFLLVVGSVIAIWWWRLARTIAPYQDEAEAESTRKSKLDDAEVVIIQPPAGGPPSDRAGPGKAG